MIFWMQVLRALLVYDVKINQLGRKNLAVRFDLDQARWLPHHRPQERWAGEALQHDLTRRFPLVAEALARLRSRSCII